MGAIRDFFFGPLPPAPDTNAFTAEASVVVPPEFFGLTSYADPIATVGRLSRSQAMQVPAVKRVRELVCDSIGTLPLRVYDTDRVEVINDLLAQPERGRVPSITMTRTVEDLFFEGVAYWVVTERSYDGYPRFVERVAPQDVALDDAAQVARVGGRTFPYSDLIQFESPNDALLVAGARSIRTCLRLDAAALNMAEGVPPLEYFTPKDGADPADDETVVGFLDGWNSNRRAKGGPAYVPAALEYHSVQWDADKLQLHEARQHAVLEIARAAGVDPEELGVSTTSRTYANSFDRRKAFIDFTLSPYMYAIAQRLSLGDVTKRGFRVEFDLDGFLRSDTLTRFQAYEAGRELGIYDDAEIRALEGRPAAPEPAMPTLTASAPDSDTKFLGETAFSDDAQPFEVEPETRTIRGLAVPYGKTIEWNGRNVRVERGSLKWGDVGRVKVLAGHSWDAPLGRVIDLEETDAGLVATLKIARGAEGDRALTYAEDGVWDGLSIGCHRRVTFARDDNGDVLDGDLNEISLTGIPLWDDARVTSVAASGDVETQKETTMTEQVDTPATEPSVDFAAEVTSAIRDGFAAAATSRPDVVAPNSMIEVKQPSPYRFDGTEGEHSFSADVRAAMSQNNEATERLNQFFAEFSAAVSTSNVTSLNPTQNRPDLYVPNLTYTRPLWNLVTKGTVNDVSSFTIPKFSSINVSSTMVTGHTQGVEPDLGSFSTTVQTVQPAPISGKFEINREVLDLGGTPKVDAIIWAEMLNCWYEGIESRIASMLNGLSLTETNLGGATDEALVDSVQNVFVNLQFVRGGNRYSALALDGQLFSALVNASDTSGRKLLPVVNPTNAQGSTNGNFSAVQVGSQTGVAAWALGSTNASNSYLFVPSSVYAWASAPKRLDFDIQVKSVFLGLWGYAAAAVTRDSDVKRLDYTSAD